MEWLKRFLVGREESESDVTAQEVVRHLGSGSRKHHYVLCHQLLPQLAFDSPPGFLSMTAHPKRLRDLWKHFGETLPPEDRVRPVGLTSELRMYESRFGLFSIGLLVFPKPRRMLEAWFAAFSLGPVPANPNQTREEIARAAAEASPRYFTLELSLNNTNTEVCTVFCEQTAEPRHLNYGDGPAPELEAFYFQVCRHLENFAESPIAGFTPGSPPETTE